MILVTSAGNGGSSGFPFVGTPGDSPGMLTIGAVDSDGDYVSFSSIGPTIDGRVKPDVMAQGRNAAVVSSIGNVTTSNGTSFSSPIMAGAVASLWQARPEVPNAQIISFINLAPPTHSTVSVFVVAASHKKTIPHNTLLLYTS